MPRLEEWSIVAKPCNPFQAPELWSNVLHGKVYDNERFEDESEISTSNIHELNLKENYAQTRNTRYELGKPSEEYLNWLDSNGKTLEDYIIG
jgi:hypothetical protein